MNKKDNKVLTATKKSTNLRQFISEFSKVF